MRILLTGGGTGGHIKPLIAIAEELNNLAEEEKLVNFKIYYASDKPFENMVMEKELVTFIPIIAGKIRVYPSLKNLTDAIKTLFGVIGAIFKVFKIYPDAIIGKGGYLSFPVIFAGRILGIPIIIHESDTVPGRVNRWAGKFAKRVAVSFPESAEFFPKEKISYTGQPIRKEILNPAKEGGIKYFNFVDEIPVIGILGGSQGAKNINNEILEILPKLVEKYQIIHQVGDANLEEMKIQVSIVLKENPYKDRYKMYGSLNDLEMKMFAGAVKTIISRSGSSLFEFSAWGKPSILIPYPLAHGDHQKKNAYHYARAGACVVIEEPNLTSSVLLNEIERITDNKEINEIMSRKAKEFFKPDAARIIASEAISIALTHIK